jgi:hypothetical protein
MPISSIPVVSLDQLTVGEWNPEIAGDAHVAAVSRSLHHFST